MTHHAKFTFLVAVSMVLILVTTIFTTSTSVLYLRQVHHERKR